MSPSQSFVSLIDSHQRMLWKICWAYTRTEHDRDDLFQEIISQAWASFGRYDPERSFGTWAYRIALNVAIDFRRRRARSKSVPVSDLESFDPPDNKLAHQQDQLSEVHDLLERLEEADRAILVLHLEGHSYREISEVIGTSESNVGTRLSRIKHSLRESVSIHNASIQD